MRWHFSSLHFNGRVSASDRIQGCSLTLCHFPSAIPANRVGLLLLFFFSRIFSLRRVCYGNIIKIVFLFTVPEPYTNGYMPPPLSQHPMATNGQIAHGYGNPFIMPTGPSPTHQSALRTSSIPTSVIQAAAAASSSSSHDDLFLLELGYQQRVKKKLKRVKSEGAPCTGPKRKSREGSENSHEIFHSSPKDVAECEHVFVNKNFKLRAIFAFRASRMFGFDVFSPFASHPLPN